MTDKQLWTESHPSQTGVPLGGLGGGWLVDLQHSRLAWSPQARALHEVSGSEMPSLLEAVEFVDEQDRALLVSAFNRCVNQKTPFDVDLGLTSGKGTRKRVRLVAFVITDAAGRASFVVGTVQEVMPVSAAEQTLRRDYPDERFASALNDSEALARAIAIQFQAPLIVAHGFAYILAETESAAMSSSGRKYLQRILAAVTQMSGLADAVGEFASLATRPLRTQRVDLSAIAEIIFDEVRMAGGSRAMELRVQPGLVADGDLVMLRRLLDVLIHNSLNFAKKADPVRIAVKASRSAEGWVYVVEDQGVGFDRHLAGNLFAPFARFHSDRDAPGHGLGLAIASRIVERHGGRIWAESIPGGGAVFSFILAPGTSANDGQ